MVLFGIKEEKSISRALAWARMTLCLICAGDEELAEGGKKQTREKHICGRVSFSLVPSTLIILGQFSIPGR
jgi:hypothetical protein